MTQIDIRGRSECARTGFRSSVAAGMSVSSGIALRSLFLLCAATSLPSCSLFVTAPEMAYTRSADRALYSLEPWLLEGRLALTGERDSWNADIVWNHSRDEERIKLSGPLGQGAVLIHLNENVVTVTRADGSVESSDDPEAFINRQLGLFVPISSLRYWVVGLPEPGTDFADTGKGFRQSGWAIDFQSMQKVGQSALPRKISVSNGHVKLKLIIDQWTLNNGNQY